MAEEQGDTGMPGIPPSFIPSASRQRPSSSGVDAAPPSFIPPSRKRAVKAAAVTPAPASPTGPAQQMPQSFQPASKPARRATGSSRSAASQRTASPATPPRTVPNTPMNARAAEPAAAYGATMAVAAQPPRRRRHIGHIIVSILLVLILAAALGLFGVWNWVDGKLIKTPWLTDRADTPASTWLVLGSDEREGGDSDIVGFRTDTILVLTKPRKGSSSLISIPRDSLVSIDDYYLKINAVSQLYDGQSLVSEVEQITGQKIDHVAQIKFNGLKDVVNALGGIELCYDSDVSDPYSGLEWQAGCHMADGDTALAFSRMRYADATGDFGRGDRQRQVIGAIMDKGLSSGTLSNPGTVMSVADTTLNAITVDEQTNPYTLLMMALAFRDATGASGITGSVYWSNPDYYVDGVGSSVLLDDQRNLELFTALADGTHEPGVVGALAESQ